jgi:hypothetical protein
MRNTIPVFQILRRSAGAVPKLPRTNQTASHNPDTTSVTIMNKTKRKQNRKSTRKPTMPVKDFKALIAEMMRGRTFLPSGKLMKETRRDKPPIVRTGKPTYGYNPWDAEGKRRAEERWARIGTGKSPVKELRIRKKAEVKDPDEGVAKIRDARGKLPVWQFQQKKWRIEVFQHKGEKAMIIGALNTEKNEGVLFKLPYKAFRSLLHWGKAVVPKKP